MSAVSENSYLYMAAVSENSYPYMAAVSGYQGTNIIFLIKCQKPVDIQTNSVLMNNCLNYYAINTQTLCKHFDYMREYQQNHADLLKKRWPF